VVGTVLPLAEGAEALRLLQRREARGKLVLSVG
jgi:NADPH:quinone reductase-like Zn-dependent oxidoreductase